MLKIKFAFRKMLRIDVNSDNAYNIPSDNPFVGIDGADEIGLTALGMHGNSLLTEPPIRFGLLMSDKVTSKKSIKYLHNTRNQLRLEMLRRKHPYNTTGCAKLLQ
jgi:hypothetical protein